MVRLALLLLLLLVSFAMARADDDDAMPEPPPLGDAIPERLQALEREWADDVGLKDPAEEQHDDADTETAEPQEPKDDDDEPQSVKARPIDQAPRPEPPSARDRTRGDDARAKPASKPATSDAAPPAPPPVERRATGED